MASYLSFEHLNPYWFVLKKLGSRSSCSSSSKITTDFWLNIRNRFDTTRVLRILKPNQWHPYKIQLLQELIEDHNDQRLFTIMRNKIRNICKKTQMPFSCWFLRWFSVFSQWHFSLHNCLYLLDTNPKIWREVHTLGPQNLNIWTGIFGIHKIGPYFFSAITYYTYGSFYMKSFRMGGEVL